MLQSAVCAFNTGPYTVLPGKSILITANMQSETGFPSSHQLKSYVASKSRLKLAALAVLSADAGLLVSNPICKPADEQRQNVTLLTWIMMMEDSAQMFTATATDVGIKWTLPYCVRSLVVDEERMSWLVSVFWFSCSVLTLLVGRQEGHAAYKTFCHLFQWYFSGTGGRRKLRGEGTGWPSFMWKVAIKTK